MTASRHTRPFAGNRLKPAAVAKITRPVCQSVLVRSRLFRLLSPDHAAPIVWVTGPPGSGKTALVSSYIGRKKLRCLWYQVDAGDADPATFFYYLGLAATACAPEVNRPMPLPAADHVMADLAVFSMRFFEELFGRLKCGGRVVLDNYHEAPGGAALHEALRHGLEAASKGGGVIVISRNEPPPQLARLKANGLMRTIGWEELRLTEEESSGIMRLKMRGRFDRAAARELHLKSGGWAAGLALMLGKGSGKGLDAEHMKVSTIEDIYNYFSSEILKGLDGTARDFLLKTAMLPSMDAAAAGRLTGDANAAHMLSELHRRGCFIEKLVRRTPVYQYHPLFREYLLYTARRAFSPAELARLKLAAAAVLEESERFDDAFTLYREAGGAASIAGMVLRNAPGLVARGRCRVMTGWITCLPEKMLEEEPWLLYWLGICGLACAPHQSREHLERAHRAFRERRDAAGCFMSWAGIVASIRRENNDLRLLDGWIDALDALIREFGKFPSREVGDIVAAGMYISLSSRRPGHAEFDRWEELALEAAERRGDARMRTEVRWTHFLNRTFCGDFAEAGRVLASMRQAAEGGDALDALVTKGAEALYHTLTGSASECMKTVREAMRLGESSGIQAMDSTVLGNGALSALNACDFKTADELIGRLGSPRAANLYEKSFYHFLLAQRDLLTVDIGDADGNSEAALRFALELGHRVPVQLCHLLRAVVGHRQGDREKADRHLEQYRALGASPFFEFGYLLMKAGLSFDRGEDEAGAEPLAAALKIGRARRYYTTYLWYPRVMSRLCQKALERGIEPEYVTELIRRRKFIHEAPVSVENWPWQCKVYTLGRFQFLRDGRPVRFERKAQTRPLDLLKTIISLGGRGVSFAQVADRLWPESDGYAGRRALLTTLCRLRDLMGSDDAVEMRDGRLSLNPTCCWVDVWAFERLLGEVEREVKGGYSDRIISKIERAAAMYQGDFLAADQDKPWAEAIRARMKQKLARQVGDAGRWLEGAAQFKRAILLYQKAIEADPLAEAFYRRIMVCYQGLGRPTEAIVVYNRLEKLLATTLGISPSRKTEAVRAEVLTK